MLDRPISLAISPNTQREDVFEAIKTIFQPWLWKKGQAIEQVKKWFRNYFGVDRVYLFNSGRSSLYFLLKSLGIGKGDEVVIQAFTCVAVAGPIIWTGAKPIYVDIDESLNIDIRFLEKSINKKTKAIIVQHTFGIPAKIDKIKLIAQKYNLVLIEDCAHSLGGCYGGKKLGSFGDYSFFSFGRDKVVSSVFGGALIINKNNDIVKNKLEDIYRKLNYPSYYWIFQQLFHPIATAFILPLYNILFGKLLLFIFQKLRLLSKPVSKEEYFGGKPAFFPAKYPNALARLLVLQLSKLDKYNNIRIHNSDYYFKILKNYNKIKLPIKKQGAIYLRFNIQLEDGEILLDKAKKQNILLGKWYKAVIDPRGVDYKKIGYKVGSCPFAEKVAKLSVNLPNYPKITREEIKRVTELVIKIYGDKRD